MVIFNSYVKLPECNLHSFAQQWHALEGWWDFRKKPLAINRSHDVDCVAMTEILSHLNWMGLSSAKQISRLTRIYGRYYILLYLYKFLGTKSTWIFWTQDYFWALAVGNIPSHTIPPGAFRHGRLWETLGTLSRERLHHCTQPVPSLWNTGEIRVGP